MTAKQTIEAGKAILGIEFGSTRIKAVLIDEDNKPIMVSGPTLPRLSGTACRIAMPSSARMFRLSTTAKSRHSLPSASLP